MTENRESVFATPIELGPDMILQPPLSRCGCGPGLILVRPSAYSGYQQLNKSLDPEPLLKWAEESFAVVQITLDAGQDLTELRKAITQAREGLTSLPACDSDSSFGVLIYGAQEDYLPGFNDAVREIVACESRLAAVVCFDEWHLGDSKPTLLHVSGAGDQITSTQGKQIQHVYPQASSPGFMVPGHPDFIITAAGVAHTRSLTFLKKHLGGPYFDLEQIWDEHTYYEFGDRSVEKTMATMVQEPYVNHVPTLTGGIGRARLSHFYLNHFIFSNPDDTALELISRTVGTDRIVDEFIFCLTHVKQVDWLLPGVPPTGKHLRIPFTSVVNIRGDRLYHEHIAWDQATVLVQLGLLPQYLPFPYALPDGRVPTPGHRFEYRVPAAGVESAQKLQNEHEVPSNAMFEYGIREVKDA
ncbi:hypothetical protein N7462_008164 [Penicillium macrosclerotiorum]|uniref:uncharacterized protein n=1 Tax=Penicillium macrosclerotiorum TaxID=303699 RepID=UPI0025470B74|nr:uncharacterized protein N7462_008164 [Penicillium macrosclerotiorum]KAJ5679920.1 hypothetical protein N7462_008164 [Penicillium macrosclerotiorum]